MKIKLNNVRLSFPSLFRHAQFNGVSTEKYEATFILDPKKNAKELEVLRAEIARLQKEELKTKLPSDKICLKDGDESGREEMAGAFVIKTSAKRRPVLVNRDRETITEDDNLLYAGCYVNAIVSLWPQSNGYGKRVNASLEGVQFAQHGDPFAGAAGASADDFDSLNDDLDDDLPF